MKRHLFITLALLVLMSSAIWAANTKSTVSQVTSSVVVNTDIDYVVTGEIPFTDNGIVDLTKTDHAVLILERIKPSKTIPLLAAHVRIKGAVAQNGKNCQVRLYGTRGAMILPYASTDKPLTVYSGQNFTGESCSDFGLENDGGYMVTLTDKKLNNRIRSFRLKRGYMVTFATRKSGYGYQRCFIANDADVEMATLPQILDEKITSYRIFKWNTAGKKGLASNTDATAVAAVGAISCYGWDTGHDMQPDVECVPNHLYEDYPTSSACGKVTWSCHMKTNNEPLNSADDKPQSLNTILGNWQNLMRTGMRLCSPSSWDGSDYTDGSGFLKQFFDSIDARGWRCDIADLHCYWLVDNFDKIGTMQSKYKRPIWISEWIWGASWNKNGAFESGKTKWDNEWAVKTICNKLNGMGYVERYFYWNSEASVSKLYEGGKLTPAGEWYANQLTGMGYNKSYEKVPNTPPMRGGFSNFSVTTAGNTATIAWHDYDGEYNQLMEVLRKEPGGAWQTWQTVRPEDDEANYRLTDDTWTEGVRYRLHIKSFSGRDYYSSQDVEPGEAITLTDGSTRYVGGNVISNGQFDMGTFGWTNGTGAQLDQPWFQVVPNGVSGGYLLQAYGNKGKDDAGSVKTAFDVVPGQDYIIRMATCNAGDYLKVDLRQKGQTADANAATLNSRSYWATQQATFNTGQYNEALLALRWLAAKAQITDVELCRLFTTHEEAISDGITQAFARAEAATHYNTRMPQLNTELQAALALLSADGKAETLEAVTKATSRMLRALADLRAIDSLQTVVQAVGFMDFDGREELELAVWTARNATTAADISEARYQLEEAIARFIPMTEATKQPHSPDFTSTDGWKTKTGTFTGGDQRTATQQGKTCWNAWWSGIDAAQGTAQTMAVEQQISNLTEGLYVLECKASTQHYCLSDQHGFISSDATGTVLPSNAVTPTLTRDLLDVPSTPSAWQTLTSTPVYVADGGTLTIGFIGSKQGATDNAWLRVGNEEATADKREGWWCATDFRLLYHPLFRFATQTEQWRTLCLPYAFRVPEGVKLYQVAGLTADYKQLCLEEVEAGEPGHPYIYQAAADETIFYTYGKAAIGPVSQGTNNLRGYFKTSLLVPLNSYVLKDDGQWYRITADRPYAVSYGALLTKAEGLPVYRSWDGVKMPINNVADELGDPDAIDDIATDESDRFMRQQGQAVQYYDLQGRRLNDTPKLSGPYIKTNNAKSRKVLK